MPLLMRTYVFFFLHFLLMFGCQFLPFSSGTTFQNLKQQRKLGNQMANTGQKYLGHWAWSVGFIVLCDRVRWLAECFAYLSEACLSRAAAQSCVDAVLHIFPE